MSTRPPRYHDLRAGHDNHEAHVAVANHLRTLVNVFRMKVANDEGWAGNYEFVGYGIAATGGHFPRLGAVWRRHRCLLLPSSPLSIHYGSTSLLCFQRKIAQASSTARGIPQWVTSLHWWSLPAMMHRETALEELWRRRRACHGLPHCHFSATSRGLSNSIGKSRREFTHHSWAKSLIFALSLLVLADMS